MRTISLENYDPKMPGNSNLGLFGVPQTFENAKVCVIPVPFEVTVSYQSGTASAPRAILEESAQLDLAHPHLLGAWKFSPFLIEENKQISLLNSKFRRRAARHIKMLEQAKPYSRSNLAEINKACHDVCSIVRAETRRIVEHGKIPGVLGGDHSTPLGAILALADKHEDFGILHIDAHMDLRVAYEGFEYSHASVMYNASRFGNVKKILQIGVRDFSEDELSYANNSEKISYITSETIARNKIDGKSFAKIIEKEIDKLPQKVYISFDIDGLDLPYCRGTGTPVPGGLSYEEAIYLIDLIWQSGRQIIGFDLCEVAPEKDSIIDASIGARILFRLSTAAFISLKNRR
ncbi:MAG: agmatinase family protein [Spirochaetales bacterium]|nr:agmatinase family protein [Spirochaetales bacterium]